MAGERTRQFRLGAPMIAALMLVAVPECSKAQTMLDLLGLGNSAQSPTGLATTPTMRTGQPTQTTGAATAPNAVGQPAQATPAGVPAAVQATGQLQPFGASLFANPASAETVTSNPNYVIQVGDSVSIRVWGGITAESTSVVDSRGNVYLPGVGPILVAGVTAGGLQAHVQEEVSKTFTNSVQVYAVLQNTHQVGVFVTGFVKYPGRHLGAASDSALDYLVRAGGIDPSRGSYRDITLQRRGKAIAQIDLYQFLLTGVLPPVNLREGDAIVVAKQSAMIAAGGSARNNYLFEVPDSAAAGHEIIDLARPLPAATHAFIRGTRDNQPYAVYLTLNGLAGASLYDQDQVTFVTDAPAETVSVQIQGSRIGPSVLVADRDIQLSELLNYVAVNPRLADTKSVYILRPSVAAQQSRTIQEAIDRLDKSLFYAVSSTTGEAQIRASEAQLIASYIQRARTVQPDGRLVVTDDDGRLKGIRLEDNDVIVIPEKSQTVMVSGEVRAPQAVVYSPEFKAEDYIERTGGFTERGRKGNYLISRANGELFLNPDVPLKPGDELIVLPYIDSKNFQLVKDFVQVLYEVGAAGYYAHHF